MAPDPLIGQKIGNYLVTACLGRGGMGSVYLAQHPEIGRKVAIKVLFEHLSHQPGFASRFLDEARVIAQLDHPNIVEIYDFGRMGEGSLYYVMEVLKGVALGKVLARCKRLSTVDALPYVDQICSALQVAHQAGVVHRDLKLDNIFVLQRTPVQVKLLDFGIAKVLGRQAGSQTSTGEVIGTPTFMSPEQAASQSELVGPHTDLYSLGVVLFYMLTGRPPFTADTAPEVMVMHLNHPPPPLRSVVPSLPLALEDVVARCLAKDPADRPPSAAWIAESFTRAIGLEQMETGRKSVAGQLAELPTREINFRRRRSGPKDLPYQVTHAVGDVASQGTLAVSPEEIQSGVRGETGVPTLGMSTLSAAVGEVSGDVTVPPPRRRRWWMPVAMVGSLLGVAVVLGLIFQDWADPPAPSTVGSGPDPSPKNAPKRAPVVEPLGELDAEVSVQHGTAPDGAMDGASNLATDSASAAAPAADGGADQGQARTMRRRRITRRRRLRPPAAKVHVPTPPPAPKKKPPRKVGAGTLDF